ncbi:hypothetical protein BS50DRAFT_370244 [Corynespora cassiicola Philippines]|uniref:RING-CH-type domain-containing protein n=1 Tax=Corynespora cassiicola Philippines TaxID=1448308 RepID=A0A2T2NMG3_CORCC|nr:hypothetical protein BS50DRAFT_370244 [Corynespora cassiicola Philippines]
MASLPPQRPASQRRPSPPAEASSARELTERTNSFSAASVDSQTLFLNSPPPSSSEKPVELAQKEAPAPTQLQDEDAEPRKCWICFNDETEDDETTSEWRSPCPCVLVAHERCLLDWIADMEAPSSRRRAGNRVGKIQCPQCKSEIRLERPRSFIVDSVRAVERMTGMMLLPGFIFVTATAAYSTLKLAGIYTINQIFGREDGLLILHPLYEVPTAVGSSMGDRLLEGLRQHWRLDIGLPLIPAVLVASRTTLADSFLPFLPLIFFVTQPRQQRIRRERNIAFSTTSLADTILGALIFPSIAAAVGEALKQVLPQSWVTPPASGAKPTGFLQSRWARSIVGGCLFVGVKDAVLLYVRWKMAQNHRHRRVLDYDRKKDKKKSGRA